MAWRSIPTARCWWPSARRREDCASGEARQQIIGHSRTKFDSRRGICPVRYVSFSSDGKLLASANDNHVLVLRDPKTRAVVSVLADGGPFAFSPDGKSLAVAPPVPPLRPKLAADGKWVGNETPRNSRLVIWSVDELLDARCRLAEQARNTANELVQAMSTQEKCWQDHGVIPRTLAVLDGPHSQEAVPILIAAMENPNVTQKEGVAVVLGQFAARHPESQKELSGVAGTLAKVVRSDPSVDTRRIAAAALAQLPAAIAKAAVPALDRCRAGRRVAARAVGGGPGAAAA